MLSRYDNILRIVHTKNTVEGVSSEMPLMLTHPCSSSLSFHTSKLIEMSETTNVAQELV